MHPDLTPGLDVAMLVFWAFVLFFVCLVFYLRREDRREGYPLEDELSGRLGVPGGPLSAASPKSFLLPFGHGTVTAPTHGREPLDIAGRRVERFSGAPYTPTGNPLVDGIGPAAWAERRREPDLDMEGHPRIVPLSRDGSFAVSARDPGLIGWPVLGLDHRVAGPVTDLWIDRADRLVRYIELRLDGTERRILAPMTMARVDRRGRRIVIDALTAAQFADAPTPEGDGVITFYEEERVQAYFGGGYLYATAARAEPLL